MKAEEIMRALHLTAMGRVNAPEQQRLCEELERLIALERRHAPEVGFIPSFSVADLTDKRGSEGLTSAIAAAAQNQPLPEATKDPMQYMQAVAKRGPGRPKKAE